MSWDADGKQVLFENAALLDMFHSLLLARSVLLFVVRILKGSWRGRETDSSAADAAEVFGAGKQQIVASGQHILKTNFK